MPQIVQRLCNAALRPVLRRRLAVLDVASDARIDLSRVRGGGSCRLVVGEGSIISAFIAFERPGAEIVIGQRTFIGKSRLIAATRVEIGDDVLISWDVTVVDHHSHSLRFDERRRDVERWRRGEKVWDAVRTSATRIESKAWIGFGASVLSGVTVGAGAVIGACAVVTKDVPPWTVWAGNPARQIRELTAEESCR